MDKKQKAEELLHNLREAIDEALADSPGVLAAMSELEDAGLCPSFSINVAIPPEKVEPPSTEMVTLDGGLVLTQPDESFLRTVGISCRSMNE
jgi:hypothetical protein